jgi:hypothetical protein
VRSSKYGASVDVEHREAVIASLEQRREPGDLAAARQTRRQIERAVQRIAASSNLHRITCCGGEPDNRLE